MIKWKIKKLVKKCDYIYAVVPEHPKATKNGYVLQHRIVAENQLGRMLLDNEIVHHKDENKKNNEESNLEVLDRVEHLRLHGQEKGLKVAELLCVNCEKVFERRVGQTFLCNKNKYNFTACSKVCRGKFSSKIQYEGLTDEVMEKISLNLIRIYVRYRKDMV